MKPIIVVAPYFLHWMNPNATGLCLFPFVILRYKLEDGEVASDWELLEWRLLLNHETIHWYQQLELQLLGFAISMVLFPGLLGPIGYLLAVLLSWTPAMNWATLAYGIAHLVSLVKNPKKRPVINIFEHEAYAYEQSFTYLTTRPRFAYLRTKLPELKFSDDQ